LRRELDIAENLSEYRICLVQEAIQPEVHFGEDEPAKMSEKILIACPIDIDPFEVCLQLENIPLFILTKEIGDAFVGDIRLIVELELRKIPQ
jgi:hypothetical protein